MPDAKIIQDYRRRLALSLPTFLRPRRFVAEDDWTRATSTGGGRFIGVLREYEPDLPAILTHQRLLILGEPGAGKSTTGQAIIRHILETGQPLDIPILAYLKSYDGQLRTLLLRETPSTILDAREISRTYILDGIDEVADIHHAALVEEINNLLRTDATANLVLMARQAFFTHHPNAFPQGITAFHLLDFDDHDIRAYAEHEKIDADKFLKAVRDADCIEEVRNPLVLSAMLSYYRDHQCLNPYRSANISFVVGKLIESRPFINVARQRRALRMLATACEVAARNELTEQEAIQLLREAIELTSENATRLLRELSHSILVSTPGRIGFQMRSYGEYLAAEELHDQSLERLKEVAFLDDSPIETWANTVTFLAEMNEKVLQYFAHHYPEWLLNVSPSAFTEEERTVLTRQLLQRINESKGYIIDQKDIAWRRFPRLLTPAVIADVRSQLASTQPHEMANALVLLGLSRDHGIVAQAVQLATAHRNASSLRYSAIIAIINAADSSAIDALVDFAQPGDPYYMHFIDAIGSLCTPGDFPRVLPLLASTNAGLSAAFYHFRELRTKDAVTAAIDYLVAHPETLNGYRLDAYLEPLIDLVPSYWDDELADKLGLFLAGLEQVHYHDGKLGRRIFNEISRNDRDSRALRAMIASLASTGTPLHHINHAVISLVTAEAARWIAENANQYGREISWYLPHGAARDILAPRTPEEQQYELQTMARYAAEERQRQEEATSTRTQHQGTICTTRDINALVDAAQRLPKEHWPEISPDQQAWLAQAVNETLERLDLGRNIRWLSDREWQRPNALDVLLELTDFYNLRLANDVPIILALRAWHYKEISVYCRRNGLSPAAQTQLANLLSQDNDNIFQNIINFLRESEYNTQPFREILARIALDTTRTRGVRGAAIQCFQINDNALMPTLRTLADDSDESMRYQAFRRLVTIQERGTIVRGIRNLTDENLRAAEIPFPNSSPLDWIGDIKAPFAIEDLRTLRVRTLALDLWRITGLITGTIANIDKNRAATIILEQLPQTPENWREHLRQEAGNLERTARVEAIQQTPFETVIRKLKGVTSMLRVKVWCEGSTDLPIFRKLLHELGEDEIANTLDFVAGWSNLLAKKDPERWLDGCRQAIIVMDGDLGRNLRKNKKPKTNLAKDVEQRFRNHPLTLRVLRRYGIENYLPQRAYEAVIGRDLVQYFPIPPDKKIENHFCEPRSSWRRWLDFLLRRQPTSFYKKTRNEEVAEYLSMADISGTDLAEILQEIKQRAEEARRY